MGALNRLVAYQAVNETQINAETAKQLLGLKAEAAVAVGAAVSRSAAPAADEFGQFLADVTVGLGKAVEAWRARGAEAILRWGGEGYRTRRLEAPLGRDAPTAVGDALRAHAKDGEGPKTLET